MVAHSLGVENALFLLNFTIALLMLAYLSESSTYLRSLNGRNHLLKENYINLKPVLHLSTHIIL